MHWKVWEGEDRVRRHVHLRGGGKLGGAHTLEAVP